MGGESKTEEGGHRTDESSFGEYGTQAKLKSASSPGGSPAETGGL